MHGPTSTSGGGKEEAQVGTFGACMGCMDGHESLAYTTGKTPWILVVDVFIHVLIYDSMDCQLRVIVVLHGCRTS